ncbi:DNA cytosine methyltransferase [bacterium]|nr:DNA cytosine methyltransferase [bacterium]
MGRDGENNVDNTKEFRSIELCAGYNGIHLGLKRVIKNLRTVAYVEIEAFADANLVAKMEAGHLDAAPIWTDLKTFNAKPFRDRIHLVTGGYPCQPFSAAGKRLGADDPRHLWPYIHKIVETIRPVFCFFENVEGHLSLGFKEVQQSLRDLGYAVEAECGAPQQRKRLFILGKLAYSGLDARCSELWEQQEELPQELQGGNKLAEPGGLRSSPMVSGSEQGQERKSGKSDNCCSKELGNSESNNKRGESITTMHRERITLGRSSWPSRPGQAQYEWEPPRVVANSVSLRKSQPERSEQNERGRTVNESEELANDIGGKLERGSRVRIGRGKREPEEIDGMLPRRERHGARQIKPPVGLHSNENPGDVDRTLTDNGSNGIIERNKNHEDTDACLEKRRSREVVCPLWKEVVTEKIQWKTGRLQHLLKEKVLRSGVRLEWFTQRICYFVWVIQESDEIQGYGLHGMWLGESSWDTPQGRKPTEQLQRELAYAMCQLSYEIALERGKSPMETARSVQGVWEDWEAQAWNVSEALPEMEEIWKSSFDKTFRQDRIYLQATHAGRNRTDELRLLGNGVMPDVSEKAFVNLSEKMRRGNGYE